MDCLEETSQSVYVEITDPRVREIGPFPELGDRIDNDFGYLVAKNTIPWTIKEDVLAIRGRQEVGLDDELRDKDEFESQGNQRESD